MPFLIRFPNIAKALLALSLWLCLSAWPARAQAGDGFEEEADPFKLFERCQNLHAQGTKENLQLALECYEEAIKLRPEFPEAEFQKAAALLVLNRLPESEQSFRRAAELRPSWALARAWLGAALARQNRDREAEPELRRALQLESGTLIALTTLADLRTRAGDAREALELWRRATATAEANASHWHARGEAERATGDPVAALKSFARTLSLEPANIPARVARAALLLDTGATERALEDLQALREVATRDVKLAVHLAKLYLRANRLAEARHTLAALPAEAKSLPEVTTLTSALAEGEESPESAAALGELVQRDPKNAALHARLGALYRRTDPPRALQHYRTAIELEPSNTKYATGYGAALVQARRFEEAAGLLRRVVAVAPENYEAHANLATALEKLKLYREALIEYNWLHRARPDHAIIYFFMARMHDLLGEYPQALGFYETFLARAKTPENGDEIAKINLRLPSLRNQIKLGEGVKDKRKSKE